MLGGAEGTDGGPGGRGNGAGERGRKAGAPRGPGGGFGKGPGRGGQGRSPPPSAGTGTNPGGPRSALTCTGSFSCAAARPPPPPPQRGALPPRPPPPPPAAMLGTAAARPPSARAERLRQRARRRGPTRPGAEPSRPPSAAPPAPRAASGPSSGPAGAAPPAAVSPEWGRATDGAAGAERCGSVPGIGGKRRGREPEALAVAARVGLRLQGANGAPAPAVAFWLKRRFYSFWLFFTRSFCGTWQRRSAGPAGVVDEACRSEAGRDGSGRLCRLSLFYSRGTACWYRPGSQKGCRGHTAVCCGSSRPPLCTQC